MPKFIMKLLLSPAVDAPGRGWRINGFGLSIISMVMMIALFRVPQLFGSGVLVGGVWKAAKLALKK